MSAAGAEQLLDQEHEPLPSEVLALGMNQLTICGVLGVVSKSSREDLEAAGAMLAQLPDAYLARIDVMKKDSPARRAITQGVITRTIREFDPVRSKSDLFYQAEIDLTMHIVPQLSSLLKSAGY